MMRIFKLLLFGFLAACSEDYESSYVPDNDPATHSMPSAAPAKEEKNPPDMPPVVVANPPPAPTPPVANPPPVNTPPPSNPPPGEFAVDPETLSFPVVFHTGGSGAWQTEEKLRPVIAEAQRILQLAKIEILPTYSQNANPTDLLDVYFVPQVPNEPGINGISLGNAPREIYVIDNVRLTKVADQRPADALVPRYFKGAKVGDKIPVSAEQAEQGRTTAHEISHQLGLPHRQNSTNLLASGTTGWTLNAAEIATMRKTAVDKFKAKFVKVLDSKQTLVETAAVVE